MTRKRKGLPSTYRPPSSGEYKHKNALYIDKLETDIKLLKAQADELVETLLVKYNEVPDNRTKKLLIMHMGAEFFERAKGLNDELDT